jgi:hypothetical protein
MNASLLAEMLRARRAGSGRWMAKCPAHDDSSASLSIREGREGRVLMHCFAGCALTTILETVGLRMADLFAGPQPSPEQVRNAARERERREAEHKAMRFERIRLTDHYRHLWRVTDALGAKLTRTVDDAPGANITARLFHQAVEQLRYIEGKLAEVGQCR